MFLIALIVVTGAPLGAAPVDNGSHETKVCRDFLISASRIREHVCRTPAIWAKIDAEAREGADKGGRVSYRPAVLALPRS